MNDKTTPKDFFVQIGATIALYIAAGALINLVFSTIDYLNHDALARYFSPSSIVWPVSILVVLVPILYGLEWLVNRDVIRMPEKRDIWIRKWRVYLTLFLAVALIGGDLIALINTYLNGEVTGRFIWKVIIILVVAGVIGKYYFFSTMNEEGTGFFSRHARTIRHGNAWAGIVFVVAAIIGGFLIVGSPAKQRAIRFDYQRISDLTNIQYQVVNYWQAKATLPATLSDLNDPISGFTVPTDPETKVAYYYGVKEVASMNGITNVNSTPGIHGSPSFELCATFDPYSPADRVYSPTSSIDNTPVISLNDGAPVSVDWSHPSGRECFIRTIDSQRYPPTATPPAAAAISKPLAPALSQ